MRNVAPNKSTGMAEVSPAMYLEKRSSKVFTILVVTSLEKTIRIRLGDNLRWVPRECGAVNGDRAQLGYVRTIALRVLYTKLFDDTRAQCLISRNMR